MKLKDKEDKLFQEWMASWSKEERKDFVMDGFCYNRTPNVQDTLSHYEDSRPHIIFAMKDMNGCPDDDKDRSYGGDIRGWRMYDYSENGKNITVDIFYQRMFYLLWALNEMTADSELPWFEKSINYVELAQRYPLVYTNLKKKAGGGSVSTSEVRKYAKQDNAFLKEQIRGLYTPNVIYCGGGSGGVKNVIFQEIYDKPNFTGKGFDRCLYSEKDHLLVIDGYHPSYQRNADKPECFYHVLQCVQDFLNEKGLHSLADLAK